MDVIATRRHHLSKERCAPETSKAHTKLQDATTSKRQPRGEGVSFRRDELELIAMIGGLPSCDLNVEAPPLIREMCPHFNPQQPIHAMPLHQVVNFTWRDAFLRFNVIR